MEREELKQKFHPDSHRDGIFRAEDETRTRDPDLGKVVLYQLSYSRIRTRSADSMYTP